MLFLLKSMDCEDKTIISGKFICSYWFALFVSWNWKQKRNLQRKKSDSSETHKKHSDFFVIGINGWSMPQIYQTDFTCNIHILSPFFYTLRFIFAFTSPIIRSSTRCHITLSRQQWVMLVKVKGGTWQAVTYLILSWLFHQLAWHHQHGRWATENWGLSYLLLIIF